MSNKPFGEIQGAKYKNMREKILDEFLNILGDSLEEDEFDRIIDILDNAGVFKEDDDE